MQNVVVLAQAAGALYVFSEPLRHDVGSAGNSLSVLGAVVGIALLFGMYLAAGRYHLVRNLLLSQRRALAVASGSLCEVINAQFDQWELTAAERDVGLLALNGLDFGEIASLRGAAKGTVRAQMARIYQKAGVSGRAQLISWFIEDLLPDGNVVQDDTTNWGDYHALAEAARGG